MTYLQQRLEKKWDCNIYKSQGLQKVNISVLAFFYFVFFIKFVERNKINIMGTNFYRIPKSKQVMERHQKLHGRITHLDWFDVGQLSSDFRTIENPEDEWSPLNPWDEFMNDMQIHLGKRSMGWKFCWNFHDGKFYSNKQELLEFIRKGRVIDEYGELIDVEEFIKMAMDWGQPDGLVLDENYFSENERHSVFNSSQYYDKIIDGLRVSSSTDFS